MPKIVTSDDPKRDHALSIFLAAYKQLQLTDQQKQRVNLRGNELKIGIAELLRKLAAEGRVLSIGRQVDMLIGCGYHTRQNMSEVSYRALWGTEVEQFPEYVGRLDIPFLVDDTMTAEDVAACNANLYLAVHPDECTTAVPRVVHPETGALLTRWVEFVQFGRYLNTRVEDVALPDDEFGLTPTEGVHLPGQCERHLRRNAIDLCGSSCGPRHVPCVHWSSDVQPRLCESGVGFRLPNRGPGSRGRRVIPVTWKT